MYIDITKLTITLCWVALIAFWCLKLFGGNWFELGSENSKFIQFCNYVENIKALKITFGCVTYLFSAYFIMSVFLKEKVKLKHIIIFTPFENIELFNRQSHNW